jgi:hypothetical protein
MSLHPLWLARRVHEHTLKVPHFAGLQRVAYRVPLLLKLPLMLVIF